MSHTTFFFAGGGTGGHIYPLLSIAEQILARQPDAGIHFFHSTRSVDQRVFEKIPYQRTPLPATGLSFHPWKLLRFISTFRQSCRQAMSLMAASPRPVVIGAGGFVAAPVCRAGSKLGVPVALINVDVLPGRANKLSARWANEIFVQFEESKKCFKHSRAVINPVGCPLRSSFEHPDPDKAQSGAWPGSEQERPADHGSVERLDPNQRSDLPTAATIGAVRRPLADRPPDRPR